MTNIALTDTQRTVLLQATKRPDGNVEPLPPQLKGGARKKVLDALQSRGLILEKDGFFITQAGCAAVGAYRPNAPARPKPQNTQAAPATPEAQESAETQEVPEPQVVQNAETSQSEDNRAISEQMHRIGLLDKSGPTGTRANSKQAQVIAMLSRPEGATIAQICAATAWQAHTVRGTFAGTFKKKLGLDITSSKDVGGERVYKLAVPA